MYWDACTFLGLLNREADKVDDCTAVWAEAEKGDTIIFTSFLSFAEVFKAKCEGPSKPLSEEADVRIEELLRQSWIQPAVIDEKIGVAARRLMRHHSQCKKPSDAIHLATAMALNVDEMHTFDGSDLLGLDGKTLRRDGKYLKICKPSPVPPPPPAAPDLFSNG